MTIINEKKFINHEFGDKRISSQSKTKWYTMRPYTRVDYVNVVQI